MKKIHLIYAACLLVGMGTLRDYVRREQPFRKGYFPRQ